MGRGRGGRGGRGGAGRGGGGGQGGPATRVCKPAIDKLPTYLLPCVELEGIPKPILDSLTEFSNAQPFFSALERICPEVSAIGRSEACWLGTPGQQIVALHREPEEKFEAMLEMTGGEKTPIFVKRIHIVDPILSIQGDCVWPKEGGLPAPSELWMTTLEKLNDPMNEAYVDAVFACMADRMVTHGISPHWVRCYGTFPARVERYLYNISDEYSSMKRKSFWTRHQRMGLFSVHREPAEEDEGTRRGEERGRNEGIQFSEVQEMDVGDFECMADEPHIPSGSTASTASDISDMLEEVDIEAEDAPVAMTPAVRIRRICKKHEEAEDSEGSESSEGSEDSEDSDDGMDTFVEFTDFPVQVTLLEKAEGTLDELLDQETHDATKEARWSAWLFQVIAGLAVAQHWFGFVHNDLHTNNVMWVKTEQTHLYYKIHKGKGKAEKTTIYKVPTYGYIMKIIDFGRATYWLPEPAGFFISDAFYPGNDAGHQYNCEPFFDARNGKKVEPNPSFDLCRLAISLLESLFPQQPAVAKPIKIMSREGPKTYAETESPLYNLIWEWLTDDAGKNMLRKPDGEERYPDFDLYAAIAADVHKAVPALQIEKGVFRPYAMDTEASHKDEKMYDLWI